MVVWSLGTSAALNPVTGPAARVKGEKGPLAYKGVDAGVGAGSVPFSAQRGAGRQRFCAKSNKKRRRRSLNTSCRVKWHRGSKHTRYGRITHLTEAVPSSQRCNAAAYAAEELHSKTASSHGSRRSSFWGNQQPKGYNHGAPPLLLGVPSGFVHRLRVRLSGDRCAVRPTRADGA